MVICSGKIYYDLIDAREKSRDKDVVIVRLEQLYPFPAKTLASILKRYKNADFIWCQEEPKNMGGWNTVRNYIDRTLEIINFKDICQDMRSLGVLLTLYQWMIEPIKDFIVWVWSMDPTRYLSSKNFVI